MKESFIGQRLKQLRMEKGISECELDRCLLKTTPYIKLIESGERLPSLEMLLLLCDWLSISPTEFFLPGEKDEDWKTVVKYRGLNQIDKEQVTKLIESLYDLEQKNSAGK